MKTMAYAVVGTLVVTIHGALAPSNEEWADYVKALKDLARDVKDHSQLRNIVFTEGGAPNSAQRKAVNDIVAASKVNSAIVSSSQFVRSVVTAFSWFNSRIKAYSPEDVDDAYKHLGLSSYEIELVSRRVAHLRHQIEERRVRAAG